ncbi:DUF4226 domain-containing protein [Mycolicibacterium mengxianglii]|uniref:DUF4226 domain-containing protein n=1 Tax=Mycolicibacterium mengxianglii TaxID=2736649 RepID=UPI0018D1CF8B|nr:DUF4226 domain-containing protein [Mycolicibacterium mengxianglii]
MTTHKDLYDAVEHIGRVTADPLAWRQGLSPEEAAVIGLVVAPDVEVAAVLAKIKANHPGLFDPRTGAPVLPKAAPSPESGGEQQGVGVTAIKKAEGDLAHQNSATAQVDLLVISAVLNAHTTAELGSADLAKLQAEIEEAVRNRTDLDTPAGARDFQRYLIGKLREIGGVVQTASLDDRSKAVLAGAWTALYEASKTAAPAEQSESVTRVTTSAGPTASAGPPSLPAYGADLGADPLLDQLLAQEPPPSPAPSAAAGAVPPAPAAAAIPIPAGGAGLPTGGLPGGGAGMPAFGTPAAGSGWTRPEEPPSALGDLRDPDALTLEDLLADPEAGLSQDPDEEQTDPDTEPEPEDPAHEEDPVPETAQVRLPNGDVVTAPSPQLAKVVTAAIAGTPIGEAFHQHGLTIPPPGTAVAHPVDPAEVSTADIGMFTDRQALALDRTRALLGGEIQPLSSVSGPSFLGWMHPPQSTGTAPSAAAPAAPPSSEPPAPTRPATTPAH